MSLDRFSIIIGYTIQYKQILLIQPYYKKYKNIKMKINSTNSTQDQSEEPKISESALRKLSLITLAILQNTQISNLTYIIMLLIDFLQQIAIVINGKMYDQWSGAAFQYIKQILTYMSFQALLKNNSDLCFGILVASIVLLLVFWIFIILLYRNCDQLQNPSQIQRILSKSLGFFLVSLRTVLMLPFLFIIIYAFILTPSTNKQLIIGLAVLVTLLILPLILFSLYLLSDFNPFSTIFFAGESHYSRQYTTLIKFSLVLYSFLDPSRKIQLQMLLVLLVIKVFVTILSHIFPTQQQYNKNTRTCRIWLEYVHLWLILFMISCKYSSSQTQLFIYFFIIAFLCLIFISYIQHNIQVKILYENFILLQDTKKIQLHVFQLIYLIDSLKQRSSRILMQGYIAFHARNCNLPDQTCPCKQMINHSQVQLQSRKNLYYQFLVSLLKGSINRASIPRRIYFLLSFIFHYRLNNKFQAIEYLLRAKQSSSSIIQKVEVACQLKLTELQIDEKEQKNTVNVTVDIIKFLNFNLKIVKFQQLLDSCALNHMQFWNQILEVNLNIQKLENCGSVIAKQKEQVKIYYQSMLELNSNNAHIMMIYGQFLAWVCNQDFQHAKLIEKAATILKNLKQSSKINGKNDKYSQNSETAIIVISCNQKQIGMIVQTNNMVKDILGYNRKQLIQENISMLMPKILAENHTLSLERFLLTSKQKYVGMQRIVPALRKDGYIVPALAFTKQIPNLQHGIQMAGFLSPFDHIEEDEKIDERVGYILYECNSEIIMGISKNCYFEYGIPKCLVYGNSDNTSNELKIKHIFGVNLQKAERGLQKQKQVSVIIDNKVLRDQFVISHQGSTNKIINDQRMQRQIRVPVLVRSIYDIIYHGLPLRLISILKELDKGEQNLNKRKSIKADNIEIQKQQKSDSKSQSDDLKNLKDFKTFISVKREPKAIRFIKYACLVLVILFFFGVAGFITLHIKQIQYISSTMQGIKLAFFNRMYLTELSFESDKVLINYSDAYPAGELFPELATIKKMNEILTQAKKCELQLLPIKNYLGVKKIMVNYFNFYPNGTYKIEQKLIDQAITIQLSKLYHIANTNGTYFKSYPLDYKSLTVTNYQEAKYTQLFSFIRSCSEIQQLITTEGANKNERTKLLLIILSSILVFLLIIWAAVSLPKTINVVEINSKVLSLFNYISPEDVRGVVNKCFVFRSRYLIEAEVDKKKMEENSNFVSKSLQTKEIRKNNLDNTADIKSKRESFFMNSLNSPGISLNSSYAEATNRVIINSEMKVKQNVQVQNFEDFEKENKLIDKDNKDKKRAIITYLFIFIFLSCYIGFTCGYLIINYNQFVSETKMMSVLYNRAAQFQQIKSIYTKYLTDRNLNFGGTTIGSMNLQLISKIYDTQRILGQSGASSQQYGIINSLNTQNICNGIKNFESFKIWGILQLTTKQCQQIDNGILTRGVKTTLVTIMEQIRSMILLPESQKVKMNAYVQTVSVIERYTVLEKYIVRPLMMISSNIADSKNAKELSINIAFYLINGFFLALILLFWKFAWQKYLEYLNQNVWRTKSMLSVIPSKIITNNELLMREFTSGQLQKIVR